MKTIRKYFNAMAEALIFPVTMGAMQILTSFALENEFKYEYVIGGFMVGLFINNIRLAYKHLSVSEDKSKLLDMKSEYKDMVDTLTEKLKESNEVLQSQISPKNPPERKLH